MASAFDDAVKRPRNIDRKRFVCSIFEHVENQNRPPLPRPPPPPTKKKKDKTFVGCCGRSSLIRDVVQASRRNCGIRQA